MTSCSCIRDRAPMDLPCPVPQCPAGMALPRGFHEDACGARWGRFLAPALGELSRWAWQPWEVAEPRSPRAPG
ncbi:MAG: hypothetical protein EOO71_17505 [Myxococcaceae bacterium]|nr:MAG: hypothetical protein EOO71_17505 [Myxococcaceae bacterium]